MPSNDAHLVFDYLKSCVALFSSPTYKKRDS